MGSFKLFQKNTKEVTKPLLAIEIEQDIVARLREGDLSVIDDIRRIGVNTKLSDGETFVTRAILESGYASDNHGTACLNFQKNDNGFHARMKRIADAGKLSGNEEKPTHVAAHFALQSTLKRLGISDDVIAKEKYLISDDFIKKSLDQFNKDVNSLYEKNDNIWHIADELYDQENPQNYLPNNDGELPRVLFDQLEEDNVDKNNDVIEKTGEALDTAEAAEKLLKRPLKSADVIAYANNNNMKEHFPWLKNYKPTEQEFIAAFSDEFTPPESVENPDTTDSAPPADDLEDFEMDRERSIESDAADMDLAAFFEREDEIQRKRAEREQQQRSDQDAALRRQREELEQFQVKKLFEMDFYKWQSERKTPKINQIIRDTIDKKNVMTKNSFIENLHSTRLEKEQEKFKNLPEKQRREIIIERMQRSRDKGLDLER